MHSKLRILAIAPYEGMKTLLQNTAKEFPDVEMTVIVGDLKAGLDLTMNRFQSDYDVLMSRGGTARLLRQSLSLPVVDIKVTANDILRTLKLANAQNERCAVVGFPNVTYEMEMLQNLLPYQIDVFSINNTQEALATLYKLINSKYSALLCDMVTHTAANKLGMNTFLITSGTESIREAIRNAVFIYQANYQLQIDNQFFRTLLQLRDTQSVVFSNTGKLVYSTQQDEQTELLHILKSKIDTLPDDDNSKITLQVQGIHYRILPRRIHIQDQSYVAFLYTAVAVSDSRGRTGILYRNRDEVEKTYLHGPYSLVEFTPNVSSQILHAAAQAYPTLFIGEVGAGQEYAAQMLYLESARSNHPFIEIDCSALQEKGWNYLINHHSSPLFDTGNTLHFLHAETLRPAQLQTLCSFLSFNNALKQNIIVFSAAHSSYIQLPLETLLSSHLDCRVISLMPLRNFPQMISRLVYLYLNNSELGATYTDAAIAPDALQILCRYAWPQNYRQFVRVMERVTIMAGGKRITADMVNEALSQEVFLVSTEFASTSGVTLDISRPLAEIEHTIAQIVLENNGGNHSLTATTLGISRSTLWRMLKSRQQTQ